MPAPAAICLRRLLAAGPTTAPSVVLAATRPGELESVAGKTAAQAAETLTAAHPQPTTDQGKPDSTGKKVPPSRNIFLATFEAPRTI